MKNKFALVFLIVVIVVFSLVTPVSAEIQTPTSGVTFSFLDVIENLFFTGAWAYSSTGNLETITDKIGG